MKLHERWRALKGGCLAAVLLIACTSPESGAVDPSLADPSGGLTDDDLIDPLDDGPDADGLKTRSGRIKHDPVVFVHGCPLPEEFGSKTNYVTSTFWQPIYEELRIAGRYPAAPWEVASQKDIKKSTIPATSGPDPDGLGGGRSTEPSKDQYLNVFVHQGEPCGPNDDHAWQLAEYVERVRKATGSARVDIVANSLGAIAARLYIKEHGRKRVRDFVILAGVNHGTDMALVPLAPIPGSPFAGPGSYDGARELFPAYACKGEAPHNAADDDSGNDDVLFRLNGCLRPDTWVSVDPPNVTVEQTDQTPYQTGEGGDIAYLNIFNAAVDELVNPTFSACLNQRFAGDCSDTRVNLPIQVAVQSVEDTMNEARDTPHGSIRNDEQAICPTVAFLMCRNKAQREACDINTLTALQAQADSPPPDVPPASGQRCAR